MGKEGRKFDTKIQYLKYKVLREVARIAYNSDSGFELANSFNDIAKVIVPGPKATMRCCIYKERAIIAERFKAPPQISRSLSESFWASGPRPLKESGEPSKFRF